MFVIASEPEYLFGPWINVLSSIDRVGAAIRGKLECLARKPTFTFTYGAEVIAAVTRLVKAGEGLAKSGPSWVTLRTVLDFVRSECAVIGPRPYATKRLPADAGRFVGVAFDVAKYDVVGNIAACRTEVPPGPETTAPVALSDVGKLLLDFA